MKPDKYMPMWIGDYLASTQMFDAEMHGAYMLLLFAYWTNGGPLPDDAELLCNAARVRPENWMRVSGRLQQKFNVEGGVWRHARCDRELLKSQQAWAKKVEQTRAAREASERSRQPKPVTDRVTPPVTDRVTDRVTAPQPEPEPELTTEPDPEVLKFNSLGVPKRREVEGQAMERMKAAFGEQCAVNWGGLWRKRFRENPEKWKRVMDDVESTMREQTIDNPGGYADDLWTRFAG